MRRVRGDHPALGGHQDGGHGNGTEDRQQVRLQAGHADVRARDAEELPRAVGADVVGEVGVAGEVGGAEHGDGDRDHVPVRAGEVDIRAVDVAPPVSLRDGEPVHVQVVVQVDRLRVQVEPDPRIAVGGAAGGSAVAGGTVVGGAAVARGPLPPLQVPVLALDHARGGHHARAVGGRQLVKLLPDDLAQAGEAVGGERGAGGDTAAPLRREGVSDRRGRREHVLKRGPDPRACRC